MKFIFDAENNIIGKFDDDLIYDNNMNRIYRVDGNEVYNTQIPCKLIGYIEDSSCISNNGQLIFKIES